MERIDIDVNQLVFAGWKIGKEIGRGAFATVYELRKGNMLRALKVVQIWREQRRRLSRSLQIKWKLPQMRLK